ncbi:MAG: tRNA (guanosine(37)-N1)-methyltransferase TrmD [Cyanobacteria bacterium]|nr:tRNA (guanosine(37)-N1)-methyltransferase TrmD [Cyanobacteriota bacterium]
MQFKVITLFPSVIETYCQTSIIGRAQDNALIEIQCLNPRHFSTDPHRKVDDSPYGGGDGMVMACQPIDDAFTSLSPLAQPARILLTEPTGRRFDQNFAKELSQCQTIVIISGHYEGIDHRIESLIPNIEPVSLGPWVMTGGELAALCIIDSISRLLPGVVGKEGSVVHDSFFTEGQIDYPHYTRPAEYKGLKVPEVLLSGNHGAIAAWRLEQSELRQKTQTQT